MSHIITAVEPHSPAARAGIRAGDRLAAINGQVILDFIDYQALTAERRLRVRVLRGERKLDLDIRKDEYAPLGLEFSSPMMSGTRLCCNKCLFCFVDQLPADARDTMRVKDDDWRMSLMMGNYVTLTNVPDQEIRRIVERHASPLYISVHCTDPDLRTRVLGTPRAARLMRQLQTLSDGGIDFHCQCVLCPGINDGDALERTVDELSRIPGARSLALVPVGLTGHREGLYDLHPYTRPEARAVLEIAERWRAKLLASRGTRFVFPSDEFYLQAGWPIPPDEAYEDYDQIDDGVGLLRLLDTEYNEAWADAEGAVSRHEGPPVRLAIACGRSAEGFIRDMLARRPVAGAQIDVYGLENTWFGPTVTVSGLITGGDLMGQLQGVDCDAIMITEVMLRQNDDRFLDDTTLPQVIGALGKPVVPVGRRGEDLLNAILALRDRRSASRS
ncbi:MAG: DUF512 domain-containing protein [Clostridia bacterium]|nr:DUF512 domain-containing protein [Clostridia bacterium]